MSINDSFKFSNKSNFNYISKLKSKYSNLTKKLKGGLTKKVIDIAPQALSKSPRVTTSNPIHTISQLKSSKEWVKKAIKTLALSSTFDIALKEFIKIKKETPMEVVSNELINTEEFEKMNRNWEINRIEKEMLKLIEEQLNSPSNVIELIFIKALEGTKYKNRVINHSFINLHGYQTYLDDIKNYKEELLRNNMKVPKELKKIRQALEFATAIATLQMFVRMGQFPQLNIKQVIDERISEKIQTLKNQGEIGDLFLLPGGYNGEVLGHAVLYEIKKTGPDTCSFTIINTGLGSYQAGIQLNARNVVEDTEFQNVSFDRLNSEFIGLIRTSMEGFFSKDAQEPLTFILFAIERALMDTNDQVRKMGGRRHVAQTTGSCAFQCVSKWIKDKLGENEGNKFKYYVTQREVEKLKSFKDTPYYQYSNNREIIDDMINESELILQKRAQKTQ